MKKRKRTQKWLSKCSLLLATWKLNTYHCQRFTSRIKSRTWVKERQEDLFSISVRQWQRMMKVVDLPPNTMITDAWSGPVACQDVHETSGVAPPVFCVFFAISTKTISQLVFRPSKSILCKKKAVAGSKQKAFLRLFGGGKIRTASIPFPATDGVDKGISRLQKHCLRATTDRHTDENHKKRCSRNFIAPPKTASSLRHDFDQIIKKKLHHVLRRKQR